MKIISYIKKIIKVLLIIILWLILLYILYSFLFLQISQSEATDIAHKVIQEKYSTACGGGFEKNLQLTINHPDAKYSFYSDNWQCNIFVDVSRFGSYHYWFMPDN